MKYEELKMKNLVVQFHDKQHISAYNIRYELKQAAKNTLFMLKAKNSISLCNIHTCLPN